MTTASTTTPTENRFFRLGIPTAAAVAMLAGSTAALGQNAGLGSLTAEDQPATGSTPSGDLDFSVAVDEYDLVDLHVNNEELGRVLQLLSIQSERNIVSSPNVQAAVTADLYGVTFYEALEAILNVNGFAFIEEGNFIYVYTKEEYQTIVQASRERVSRVVTLRYLNATDAAQFVAQLLSEDGSITTNAETDSFAITGENPTGADTFAAGATLVVHDYEENVNAIMSLIGQLDSKPVQVLVEATILQTQLTEENAFGVDFALLNNLDFADFASAGPLGAVNELISGITQGAGGGDVAFPGGNGNGSAIASNYGNVSGPASLKLGLVNEDVAFFMRVLDTVTDTTVVSNPKLLTLNRQPGRVLVGTRVGYLNTTTTETATTQTVEFLDVGTQLSLRPFVGDNGLIRLELRPQVSSATLREVSNNDGGAITVPDENTTELTTNVMVRDGQTVVLGGLFTETTTASRRQVPILGDIPLIGTAFRGHEDDTRRSEIIFLITPSIVNDDILTEDGALANSFINNSLMGARKGTLPWSRERRVGQMLIQARNLADVGQNEQAVAKVRRALALSPMSPDARQLLEELTGTRTNQPTRSILNGILHRELQQGGSHRIPGHGQVGVTPNPYAFNNVPAGDVNVGTNDQNWDNQNWNGQGWNNGASEFDAANNQNYNRGTDSSVTIGTTTDVEPFGTDTPNNATYVPQSTTTDYPQPTDSYYYDDDFDYDGTDYDPSEQVNADEPGNLSFNNRSTTPTDAGWLTSGTSFDPDKWVAGVSQPGDTVFGSYSGVSPRGATARVNTNTRNTQDLPRLGNAAATNGSLIVPIPGGGTISVDWPEQGGDTTDFDTFANVPEYFGTVDE